MEDINKYLKISEIVKKNDKIKKIEKILKEMNLLKFIYLKAFIFGLTSVMYSFMFLILIPNSFDFLLNINLFLTFLSASISLLYLHNPEINKDKEIKDNLFKVFSLELLFFIPLIPAYMLMLLSAKKISDFSKVKKYTGLKLFKDKNKLEKEKNRLLKKIINNKEALLFLKENDSSKYKTVKEQVFNKIIEEKIEKKSITEELKIKNY